MNNRQNWIKLLGMAGITAVLPQCTSSDQNTRDPNIVFILADAWDGGHHVPFIARWPSHIPKGTVNDELICHVDFIATVAAIIGVRLPNNAAEDSYNLLPVLQGQQMDQPEEKENVYFQHPEVVQKLSLILNRYQTTGRSTPLR